MQEEGFATLDYNQVIELDSVPEMREMRTSRKERSVFIDETLRQQYIKSILNEKKEVIYNSLTNYRDKSKIQFESQFEGGNLELVIDMKTHYELYMRPDTNTKTHFQWFYFKVRVCRANRVIRFKFMNFIKASMLYLEGLRPYCREYGSEQFVQINSNVKFQQHCYYYRLQFQYYFNHNQFIQFASQPPYSYTQLNHYLNTHFSHSINTLCHSLLGKIIPVINLLNGKCKVVAIVLARQHPGETVGSWVMQGFLQKISNCSYDHFVKWVIIPMLNVDGVVLGNNRTGVLGHDFNRHWNIQNSPSKKRVFPQISCLLELVESLKKKYPNKLKLLIDLHGHSSQPNIFSYGPPHNSKSDNFYKCRLFPKMIAQLNDDYNLDQCSYTIRVDKKNTLRSIMHSHMGIPYTYTIQSSFGLIRERRAKTQDYIRMGESIAEAANRFIRIVIFQSKIYEQPMKVMLQQIRDCRQQIEEYESDSESSSQSERRDLFERKIEMVLRKQSLRKRAKTSIKASMSTLKPIEQKAAYRVHHNSQKSVSKSVIYSKKILLPKIKSPQINKSYHEDAMILTMKDLHRRLQKLKNSTIGKKILVVNAYKT